MANQALLYPPKDVIEKWNDLTHSPILDNIPTSSPTNIFLHENCISHFHHLHFMNTSLSASKEIALIQTFENLSANLENYISRLFSRRSISKALLPSVDRSEIPKEVETAEEKQAREKRQELVRNAATPFFDELYNLLSETKKAASDTISEIVRFLGNTDIWNNGFYSSEIVHAFCILFYKLATLDEMHLAKPCLSNDFTNLLSYKNSGLDNDTAPYIELKTWVSMKNSIEIELLNLSQSIAIETRGKVFHILFRYIMDYVENNKNIVPENTYAYIRTALFLLRFFKPDAKADANIKEFLVHQANLHPYIPLTIELSQSFEDLIHQSGAFPDFQTKHVNLDFISIFNDMQNFFIEFPPELVKAKKNEIELEDFYNLVVKGCKCIGRTKNAIREQLLMKLLNAPADDKIPSVYERAVRLGYTSHDIEIVLRTIALWRGVHDFFRDNFQDIYALLVRYINHSVQNFTKNTLERVCIHTRKSHDLILQIMEPLREYIGDWAPGENKGGSQSNTKNLKDHEIKQRNSATPPSSIELLRIQIQHISNEGSELLKKEKKSIGKSEAPLKEKDIKKIDAFLEESLYFQDLVQFDQLLLDLGDQSDLYFREVQLDIDNVVCFPLRSSIPFILCEYALGNRKENNKTEENTHPQPDLFELFLYPFAIYDDAAWRAANILKSGMLLDEIKQEAKICLITLTSLISNFTYNSFRSYCTFRFIPPNVLSAARGKHKDIGNLSEKFPAYRLATLIKQNRFYLHGKLVDLRSLVSSVIDKNMNKSVSDIINLYSKVGLVCSIAIDKTLDILRETRRMLVEKAGLKLMPFDEIVAVAIGSVSPASFNGKIIQAVVQDICHSITYKYCMRSNPTRLLSTSSLFVNPKAFGNGSVGVILKEALSQTMTLITTDHLSAFIRLIDTGSLSFILHEICKDFEVKFNRFSQLYKEQRPRLQRLRDEPLNTPGTLVYDRFEGAYRFFTEDTQIKTIFKAMKSLGNILAVASMLDIAITLKKFTKSEIISYFRGADSETLNYNDEIKTILPDGIKSKDEILKLADNFTGKEIHPPFLSHLLSLLISETDKSQIFEETSSQFLRFETLTGFASAWSVLEFVFCIIESNRKHPNSESPFQAYGEGVMLFAAAMLCVTDQVRLHFATNIGRRLERVKDVDFASSNDERLSRFCAVCHLETSSLEWAKSVISPIVKQIRQSQQYE